jgi:hypothetical protein
MHDYVKYIHDYTIQLLSDFSTARQNIFINLLSNLWKINVSADFKGGLFLQLAAFVTL